MPLKYDFDIRSVMSEDNFSDPQSARLLALAGITFDGLSNKAALFRDPATAAALKSAPVQIRQSFLDAGFGFETYKSGAPEGCFPARDAEARRQVMTKLHQSLARNPAAECASDDFQLAAFLTTQAGAKPLAAGQFQPTPMPTPVEFREGDTLAHPSNSIVGAVMTASFGLIGGLGLLAYTALELLK